MMLISSWGMLLASVRSAMMGLRDVEAVGSNDILPGRCDDKVALLRALQSDIPC